MARLATNVAVSRESTTLILLRPIGATLALETGCFLAVLLRLLPASALALALGRGWFQVLDLVPLGLFDQLLPLLDCPHHLHARMSSHSTHQLAKLHAML